MNSKGLAVFAASMQWAGLWVAILAVRTVKMHSNYLYMQAILKSAHLQKRIASENMQSIK